MITTTAAYPAVLLDLTPLSQTGLTDASMNNNNNNNRQCLIQDTFGNKYMQMNDSVMPE